jgi:hypothetical protein
MGARGQCFCNGGVPSLCKSTAASGPASAGRDERSVAGSEDRGPPTLTRAPSRGGIDATGGRPPGAFTLEAVLRSALSGKVERVTR